MHLIARGEKTSIFLFKGSLNPPILINKINNYSVDTLDRPGRRARAGWGHAGLQRQLSTAQFLRRAYSINQTHRVPPAMRTDEVQ